VFERHELRLAEAGSAGDSGTYLTGDVDQLAKQLEGPCLLPPLEGLDSVRAH
jgi:hypothetical protein